ncbi:class I SAM-dependent methyltransferase [Flavobacterium sp. HJ-32-4]|nr:class I SAM-dependent methyltransferase [Flavobacterium sp. HJ-32-4]UMY65085.1 class I SAM-dependent methyltransferase [Flavobacterium sp. HJ-32-4]
MADDNYLKAKRIFSQHAQLYRDRFWDVSRYAGSLSCFAASLPKGARVLELGCGPGNVTAFLLERYADLTIYPTDFSPEMVALAQQENPSCEASVFDVRQLASWERPVEGILSGFVIPYLNEADTRTFLKEAADVLPAGGMLYVSGMVENATQQSGERTNSQGDVLYMYYHRLSDLLDWVQESGFHVTFQTVDYYPAGDGTTTSDCAIVARKITA